MKDKPKHIGESLHDKQRRDIREQDAKVLERDFLPKKDECRSKINYVLPIILAVGVLGMLTVFTDAISWPAYIIFMCVIWAYGGLI